MSKFTDRLKRLHGSRVRALEESDEPEQKRVFHADEPTPHSAPAATDPPPETEPTSPARRAVRQQLQRGERLKSGGRSKIRMRRDPSPSSATTPAPAEGDHDRSPARPARRSRSSDNRVGERLAELRVQTEALIEVGAIESALPMLHEMLALSPDNPYPLGALVRYWRSEGDETLAKLYEARLKNTAPY